MSTRFEKYWTESGRRDGQGDVEKKDHQLYRRPYMMGKARGKEEEEEAYIGDKREDHRKRTIHNDYVCLSSRDPSGKHGDTFNVTPAIYPSTCQHRFAIMLLLLLLLFLLLFSSYSSSSFVCR